jgi:hypothetical protein
MPRQRMHKIEKREKRKRGRPPKKREGIEAPALKEVQAEAPREVHKSQEAQKEALKENQTSSPVKRDAPETNCFVLCNGKPVKNIKELADIMEELEDHVFNFHVTPEKNDFATWVKDIFQDVELAQKLAGVKDKKHMQIVLYKHITNKLW